MYCQNQALHHLRYRGSQMTRLARHFPDSPVSVLRKWLHKFPLELRSLAKLLLFLATYGKDEDILTLWLISESIVIEKRSSASEIIIQRKTGNYEVKWGGSRTQK